MTFFDIDGTLVAHKGAERAAALAFQRGHGTIFPESPDAFVARWHSVAEKQVRRYLSGELTFHQQRQARMREMFSHDRALTDAESDTLFAEYLMRYEENWTLFPDVIPCLECLKNKRIGIISNGDSAQQREKLNRTRIGRRFSVVMISGDIGCAKPAAEIFHAACKAAQEEPKHCVFIGDDFDTDAMGSRRAGMVGIWLSRAGSDRPDAAPMIKTLIEFKG
jgi:putative hydrolase of the HAD superfamily